MSFSDGRALCFIIHHYHPELLPKDLINMKTTISNSHDISADEKVFPFRRIKRRIEREMREREMRERESLYKSKQKTSWPLLENNNNNIHERSAIFFFFQIFIIYFSQCAEIGTEEHWAASFSPGINELGGRSHKELVAKERANFKLIIDKVLFVCLFVCLFVRILFFYR